MNIQEIKANYIRRKKAPIIVSQSKTAKLHIAPDDYCVGGAICIEISRRIAEVKPLRFPDYNALGYALHYWYRLPKIWTDAFAYAIIYLNDKEQFDLAWELLEYLDELVKQEDMIEVYNLYNKCSKPWHLSVSGLIRKENNETEI